MRTMPTGAASPAVPLWRGSPNNSQEIRTGSLLVEHREAKLTTNSEDAVATQGASDGQRPVPIRRPVAKKRLLKTRAATESEQGQSTDAALEPEAKQRKTEEQGKQADPRVVPARIVQPKKAAPKPPSKPPPVDALRLATQKVGTGAKGGLPTVKDSASSTATAERRLQSPFQTSDLVEYQVGSGLWAPAFIIDVLPDGRFRLLVHRTDMSDLSPRFVTAMPNSVRRRALVDGLLERKFKGLGLELNLVNYSAQQILEIDVRQEKLAQSRDEWIELTTRMADGETHALNDNALEDLDNEQVIATDEDTRAENLGLSVEDREADGNHYAEDAPHHGWAESGMVKPKGAGKEGVHGQKFADALSKATVVSSDQVPGRRYEGVIMGTRNHDQPFGFIQCSALKGVFTKDVFVHGAMMGRFAAGDRVTFEIIVGASGQPQATLIAPAETAQQKSQASAQSGGEVAAESSTGGGLSEVSFIRTPLPLPNAKPARPYPPASPPPGPAKLGKSSSASDASAMPSQRKAWLVPLPTKGPRPPMYSV